MRRELEKKLYKEIQDEVEAIGGMDLGTDEHLKTVQAVNSTLDRLNKFEEIENEKIKLEIETDRVRNEEEKLNLERKKQRFDKVMGVVKCVGVAAGFVGTTALSIWATKDNQRFEKDYNYTTKGGQESTRKLVNLMDNFMKKF